MNDPVWLERQVVIYCSRKSGQHGGSSGIRDAGLLDSALTTPINSGITIRGRTWPNWAAASTVSAGAHHPFVDGNKRIAFNRHSAIPCA